jgi:O-antigen/teichoic acid export membrane protein
MRARWRFSLTPGMSSVSSQLASLPHPAGGLRARVLRAGGWTVAGFALGQAIRFGANLVMTRLLLPEMFGVMVIATVVMYGLALFSDLGLRQSIVQGRRGGEAAFLNTAWAVQIGRGFVIWAAALALALGLVVVNAIGIVPAGSVYAHPSLPPVVVVLSLCAVIAGFESTKLFEASRQLSLGRIIRIDIAAQLAGVLCMISWAALDRSIWALVAGGLCAAAARTLLSHAALPGTANRWQWDGAAVREIIGLGKWIFAASILGFLVNSADRLVLGALASAAVLGVYVIAYLIFSAVDHVFARIVGDVSYPALSEVARERPADLRSTYYQFHLAVGLPACAAAGALTVAGEPLVAALYDARYAEAGWMLELLALALVTLPFRVATQCFLVLGEPGMMSRICVIRLVALGVLTPVCFHFLGLAGALGAIVLSHFAWLPTTIAFLIRHGLFDLRRELALVPAFVLGLAAGQALGYVL